MDTPVLPGRPVPAPLPRVLTSPESAQENLRNAWQLLQGARRFLATGRSMTVLPTEDYEAACSRLQKAIAQLEERA